MVFRKESRSDSFQRQISALRQQLSDDQEDEEHYDEAGAMTPMPGTPIPPPATGAPESTPTITHPSGAAADAGLAVISANSTWNGTLRLEGPLRVFGRVEGEVIAGDEIFVAEGASVNARVAARHVIVAGSMEGTIECSGRLEVLSSGRVAGDVTSPSLVVHEGATVEGDLKMRAPQGASQ